MKKYRKNWLISFSASFMVFTALLFAFLAFMNYDNQKHVEKAEPQSTEQPEQTQETEYVNYDDNVGAVSFTEDQITELARNIFYLDDYLSNVKVEFEETGTINVSAKIKDKERLVSEYPELEKYSTLLSIVENQKISMTGEITDNEGMAQLNIVDVKVAGIPIDKGLLEPFIEQDEFSELFNVEYDSIEFEEGTVVFKQGLPDILNY